MNAGTVLFFKDFIFRDGSSKDKLIIILNSPQNDEPFLFCPTTSQQHRRKSILGCHSEDNYYFIDERQDDFVKNTWVVFHIIYPISAAELLNRKFNDQIYKKFELNSSLWKALKNCILKSEDIEQDYLEMIFKA